MIPYVYFFGVENADGEVFFRQNLTLPENGEHELTLRFKVEGNNVLVSGLEHEPGNYMEKQATGTELTSAISNYEAACMRNDKVRMEHAAEVARVALETHLNAVTRFGMAVRRAGGL